jgi:hypothetical protein
MKSTNLTVVALLALLHSSFTKAATNEDAAVKSITATNQIKVSNKTNQQSILLKWNLDSLVGGYEGHGVRNSKWDSSAESDLRLFAQLHSSSLHSSSQTDDTVMSNMVAETIKAVAKGCDDPIIQYLDLHFVPSNQNYTAQQFAERFGSTSETMSKSEYAPIWKFYAAIHAMEAYNKIGNASSIDKVNTWRAEARRFLVDAAKDKGTPATEIAEAWNLLLQSTGKVSREYDLAYFDLDPIVFKNWPSEPDLLVLKGRFYTDYAWEARGSGYAGTVTGEGASLFIQRLGIAEAALMQAWSLNPKDPRIARWMITVELGQGQGRARMEKWFQEAMELDTNYYDACYAKLHYLQPQWYGSKQEMLEFASECLRSTEWGGHVPLIVLDAHQMIANSLPRPQRSDYFKRPEVWSDLKQAFDKFFRLNPQATGWHHDYALYAYRAEQWSDLNRELKLLGKVNYDYFGGKDEFDKIVSAAKEHATNP